MVNWNKKYSKNKTIDSQDSNEVEVDTVSVD